MKDSKRLFYVINEEGIKQDAEILAKFKLLNNQNYIVYTYNEINDNEMVKIYSTGIIGAKGNYQYKEIETDTEWDEIKNLLKILAKEETLSLPEENKNGLTIVGEEISIRKPKKLLVSSKFASTVAQKYVEEESASTEAELKNEEEVIKISIPHVDFPKEEVESVEPISKITVPTFEELQARSKKVSEVIESSKPEVTEEIKKPEEVKAKKENYAEKFKSEVEPVLLDVFSKQQAQIDALEEELSKTKYNLFEEQKLSLSLKTTNKELTEKGNQLESELNDAKAKVDGIMNLLQGSNK